MRGRRGVATRTVGRLGAIFTCAVAKRLRPDNPVRGVVRFADQKRERRLSDDEYAALGAALRRAEGTIWPPAVACLRFLALTGWRSGGRGGAAHGGPAGRGRAGGGGGDAAGGWVTGAAAPPGLEAPLRCRIW